MLSRESLKVFRIIPELCILWLTFRQIQDFEADLLLLLWKVSRKTLNSLDYNSISDLVSI